MTMNRPRSPLLSSEAWVSRTKCARSSATELYVFYFQFHRVPSEGSEDKMLLGRFRPCFGMLEGCMARGQWKQGRCLT